MCHQHHWKGHHAGPWHRHAAMQRPPVNIQEWADRFEIFVYAPGLEKSQFQVKTTDDVLSIAYKGQEASEGDWIRREYRPQPFRREFHLSDRVDTSGIAAKYEEGILKITLPKTPGAASSGQEFQVA